MTFEICKSRDMGDRKVFIYDTIPNGSIATVAEAEYRLTWTGKVKYRLDYMSKHCKIDEVLRILDVATVAIKSVEKM